MNKRELREPSFYILAALAGGRMHGYGIIKDATRPQQDGSRSTSALCTPPWTGSPPKGWCADGEEVVDGRLRRYFALTEDGRILLSAETERMAAGVARVHAVADILPTPTRRWPDRPPSGQVRPTRWSSC